MSRGLGILHTIISALYFIVTLGLMGCNDQKEYKELKTIESLIETDLSAADSLFRNVDVPKDDHSMALYSILKTQLDYKYYREIPDDSIIRIATNYYGDKRKSHHAAMAWYSLGCVSSQLGDEINAAKAYLKALDLFSDTLVRYYMLTEQNLGNIYQEHAMNSEAMTIFSSCRNNAIRLNDSAAIAFCDYNMAKLYLVRYDYKRALPLLNGILNSPWLSADTRYYPYLQLSKVFLFDDSNRNIEKSLLYVDSFITLNQGRAPNGVAYSLKADAYYRLQQTDSALYYYKRSVKETSDVRTICDSYRRLSEIYNLSGQRDSAVYYVRLSNEWMDSVVTSTDSGDIYRTLLSHSQKPQASIVPKIVIIGLIVIIAFTVLLVVRKKNAHIQSVTEIHSQDHSEILSDFKHDIIKFQQGKLFLKMISVINEDTSLSRKDLIDLKREYRTSLPRLRSYLFVTYGLNVDEIDMCLFALLGFKVKDFSLFSFRSPAGNRSLKYRIKTKLPESVFNAIF